MKPVSAKALKPRKTPSQARSVFTIKAIFEASIQVLLTEGFERLTTTRVAERAGVSVGTLYQYYPHKEALLAGVLEQHLVQVVEAIEHACERNHGKPLHDIAAVLVNAFIDAKMARPEVSKALYAPSSELDGADLVRRMTARARTPVMALLASAPDAAFEDLPLVSTMVLTAAVGPVQAVLEMGAAPAQVDALREQLIVMGRAYLAQFANARAMR